MNQKYFLGLDIGSDSVGWAACDEMYQPLRLKGKTAWGARLFQQAKSAVERRTFRTTGRRLARRKYRLALLQSEELFGKEINKIDNTFFLRLRQSNLYNEDKDDEIKNLFPLFKTKQLEKNFYKTYPTIWHLRYALYKNDKNAFSDLRYVYLAIHNIIKRRGHFLIEGDINLEKFDKSLFIDLNNACKQMIAIKEDVELDDVEYTFFNADLYDTFLDVLKDKTLNKKEMQKKIKKLIAPNASIKTIIDGFVSLVSGGSIKSTKFNSDAEDFSISFVKDYDENVEKIMSNLGDCFAIVEIGKRIYDYVTLYRILKDCECISQSFVLIYQEHQKQLKMLKKLLIDIDKQHQYDSKTESNYYQIFKDINNEKNYSALVGVNSEKSKPKTNEEINKLVKEILLKNETFNQRNDYQEILHLCENNQLLLTPSLISSSIIPNQVHLKELKIILDNAETYYPFIKNIKEKIICLFKFRVPYYCGPLNTNSQYSNIVKVNPKTPVKPWTFETVVDLEKTKEKFMNSLTNNCTYLYGENVLPKSSLVYEEYLVLDRLNKMVVNGSELDLKTKVALLNNLILRKPKTTFNDIEKYLKKNSIKLNANFDKDNVSISGIDKAVDFTCPSHALFKTCFDLYHFDKDNQKIKGKDFDIVEDIINIMTIYADSINDGIKYLNKKYQLNDSQLATLRKLKTNKWGRLSNKLLRGIKYFDGNGVGYSILSLLEQTNKNLQQILNDNEYGFIQLISNCNKEFIGDRTINDVVNDLIENTPPIMRRSTIQALKIVDEVAKVAKHDPEVIAIEVTREDTKKKTKTTEKRKKELQNFIENFEKEINDEKKKLEKQDISIKKKVITNLLDELKKVEDTKLKGKHVYLYFKQLGYDLYTGKHINLNEVLTSDKYDIDHIIPQSLIKDDSLDNMVLVEKDYNQKVKRDLYPIPLSIKTPDVKRLWEFLKKKKAISDEKYNRLIREEPITEEELNDFVNRQINIVNQSNIVLRDILKLKYPNTRLIFAKAQYASFIRQELKIAKLRDLNDTHHAVDAYLNIISGTILDNTYSTNMAYIKYRQKAESELTDDEKGYATMKKTYNMEHTLRRYFRAEPLNSTIINNCNRHDFLITHKLVYADAAFYNSVASKKADNDSINPIHDNQMADVSKYGGYDSLSQSYFLIATDKKDNRVLVQVPILYKYKYKDNSSLEKALEKRAGTKLNIDFGKRIDLYQSLLVGGLKYLIAPSNLNQVKLLPLAPLFLESKQSFYLQTCNNLISRYPNVFNELSGNVCKDLSFDRKGEKTIHVESKKNIEIMQELINKANDKKYDFFTPAHKVRNINIEEFANQNFVDQINTINNCIILFGRNHEIAKNSSAFRKAKASILKEKIEIIYESVTGLYSKKVKL